MRSLFVFVSFCLYGDFIFTQEVTTQIWDTLYDYPCLKNCQGLLKYVEACVRVSWGLVNQASISGESLKKLNNGSRRLLAWHFRQQCRKK